jgi:putative transposase
MKRTHTEEHIVAILREQEAGAKTADVCRKPGSAAQRSIIGKPNTGV